MFTQHFGWEPCWAFNKVGCWVSASSNVSSAGPVLCSGLGFTVNYTVLQSTFGIRPMCYPEFEMVWLLLWFFSDQKRYSWEPQEAISFLPQKGVRPPARGCGFKVPVKRCFGRWFRAQHTVRPTSAVWSCAGYCTNLQGSVSMPEK